MKTEYVGDVIGRDDVDKYLFEMSQRLYEIVNNVQDLTEQMDERGGMYSACASML